MPGPLPTYGNVIPTYTFQGGSLQGGSPISAPSGKTLNKVSSSAQTIQAQRVAENATLRLIYGRQYIGADVGTYIDYNKNLIALTIWGSGPIDAIEALYIDDEAAPAEVTATHYLGAQVAPDPTLVAAFAAKSIAYADVLPNVAYSVVSIPISLLTKGLPKISVLIRGLKVRDPRNAFIALSGVAGQYAWTADSAQNSITGNIDVRAKLKLNQWSGYGANQTISGKYDSASGSEWLLSVNTGGFLQVSLRETGALSPSIYSSVAHGIANGATKYIRFTVDFATQKLKIYTSDTATGWVQLGSDITITETNIAATTSRLTCGAATPAGTLPCAGELYLLELRNGINGAIVAACNPSRADPSAASWVADTGETWTCEGVTVNNQLTVGYSDNPALALADLQVNANYGASGQVSWPSVALTADTCDELVSGEKRRTLGLVLDEPKPIDDWFEAMRAYAGCFLTREGAKLKLLPDRASAPVYTFSESAGNARVTGLRQRSRRDVPTFVGVRYTDTTKIPWRDDIAYVYAPGALEGTIPWRPREVPMSGILRYSQALREATEQLNRLRLSDITWKVESQDEAITVTIGDVTTTTGFVGLGSKQGRVIDVDTSSLGRPVFSLEEYDPAIYSNNVETQSTYPDTNLPSPADPPAVTGLVATEEVYQLENGLFASRIRLNWAETSWPFLHSFFVTIEESGNAIDKTTQQVDTTYASPPVKEGLNYVCKVSIVAPVGKVGPPAQVNLTPLGKSLIPSDIATISGFEAGGKVYLNWTPSIDIDIFRYEVRYGIVGGTWETAQFVDRVDALRLTSATTPVGTWKFYVKALDSVGQYSQNAATTIITVTSDASAFLVDSYEQTNPALTNMASYTLAPSDANLYYITEDGATMASKFVGTLSAYANILATYHASVTSTWLGEAEDFGLPLGGQWTGTATVSDISGTHKSYIGLSDDNVSYIYYEGLSQKQNGRFARMKHEALTTSTLLAAYPDQNIKLDAIPKTEVGSGVSSASNSVPVFLVNDFVQTKRIVINPSSSTAVVGTYDNVGRNELNPQDKAASIILTNTNTITSTAPNVWETVRARHPLPSTGKWYWECYIVAGGTSNRIMLGVMSRTDSISNGYPGASSTGVGYAGETGQRFVNGVGAAFGATYTTGDVIGMAYDPVAGSITFYKNNVSQGTVTGLSGEKFPAFSVFYSNSSMTARFVTTAITYAPPANHKVLPYAFDVNIFNTSGSRVVRNFLWEYEGV